MSGIFFYLLTQNKLSLINYIEHDESFSFVLVILLTLWLNLIIYCLKFSAPYCMGLIKLA